MKLRIVYTDPNEGNLCVVLPAEAARGGVPLKDGGTRPETDLEFATRIARKVVPDGATYRIVNATSLPLSRRWRNAWVDSGRRVEECMCKAKECRKKEIRDELERKGLDKDEDLSEVDNLDSLQALENYKPVSLKRKR